MLTFFLTYLGLRIHGPPPPWFDRTLLPQLSEHQIAWWDECHIEQQGGKVGDRAYQYTFMRDENGKLSKNGTYSDATLTKTSFKFPEQARFSFGVALIPATSDNPPVGKRIEMFDYTGKNICTREIFVSKMNEETKRVKGLKGKCLPWYVDTRPKDEYWMCDPIEMVKGLGGKKGKSLIAAGVKTVKEMIELTDERILTISSSIGGLSEQKLREWRAVRAHDGSCPFTPLDHRKAENPYLSRYGSF